MANQQVLHGAIFGVGVFEISDWLGFLWIVLSRQTLTVSWLSHDPHTIYIHYFLSVFQSVDKFLRLLQLPSGP
tara:strand:+ start:7876 stop:8094 length:219 start_codon:yes stop_codon:yes gene_type:complete